MSPAFERKSELLVVRVELTGPNGVGSLPFALDTGASVTLVNWEALAEPGYDPAISPRRLPLTTASSKEYAPLVRILRMKALGRFREDVGVICHTLPPHTGLKGLFGLDFMWGRKLVLDFRERTVVLD